MRWAYGRYIIPAAAVLAVVGRCDPDTVQLHAQGTLGAWQGGVPARRFAFDVPRVPATRLELRQQPVNRICVMLTFPTCGMAHPDYLPLRLLEAVLSGGTGSRLFRGIREERQLAYDVGTIFPAQAHSSHLSVYAIITRAYKMEETKAALVEELGKVQATPVDAAELARAKAYLKGRYLLSHQYSAQQALDLAKYELLGLGADFDSHFAEKIDAITAEDLQRVARAYLRQYYLVVVMPQTAQP